MSASILTSIKRLLYRQHKFYRFPCEFTTFLGQRRTVAAFAHCPDDIQPVKCNKATCLIRSLPTSDFTQTSIVFHSRRTLVTKTCYDRIYSGNERHVSEIHTSRVLDRRIPTKTCWKCGKTDCEENELFFCKCGVVQKIPENINYFQLFDLDETFVVDLKDLSEKYINLQKRLHPDKFNNASEEEKLLADEQSSLVNKAYSTLSKPLSRATYLLEMFGKPIEESDALSDPNFLTEVMSINEDIADCSSPEDLKNIEKSNQQKIDLCIEEVTDAFRDRDINSAHDIIVRYQYYQNINNKIKDLQRSWMD